MRALAQEAGRTPPPLVILGVGIAERLTPEVIAELADPAAVHTPGFVEFEDMPALYSMARALVFPPATRASAFRSSRPWPAAVR